jgi:TAK1-binding protein 1
MIDTEFAKQTSLDAVAQAVVDRVKRVHSDTFASGGERARFCPRHEDMTLLVRNFGYPLGEMSQSTAAPGMCTVQCIGGLTAWDADEAVVWL